jgi:hypothetical protein
MPLITQPTEPVVSPVDRAPTSLIAKTGYAASSFTGVIGNLGLTLGSTTSASFVTLLSVTGSGVLELAGHASNSQSSPNLSGARITIDGVQVYSFSGVPTSNDIYWVAGIVFYQTQQTVAGLANMPFYESLLIEGHGSGAVNGHVGWAYYLT